MIKQFIILFNLISVIGFNFLFEESVSIRVNAPNQVEPGSEFIVDIIINKGGQDGFAKFEQLIPEGLTASKVESGNATFSFKDQKVKCIWMALPQEDEFKISYKVQVAPSAQGTFNLDGTFSYIENNEKQQVVLPPTSIIIGDGTMAEEVVEEIPKEEDPIINEPQNGTLCTRTISPIKGKQAEFKVEIKIQSSKEGFC